MIEILALIVISAAISIVGMYMVSNRKSMAGDALAHASFGGAATAFAFGIDPFLGAVAFAVVAPFILKRAENISLSIVFVLGMGVGFAVFSISGGSPEMLEEILFGDIKSITLQDFGIVSVLSVLSALIIVLSSRKMLMMSIGEDIYRSLGGDSERTKIMLYLAMSVSIISSIKLMGVLLASALSALPAYISMRKSGSFSSAMMISPIIAIATSIMGYYISSYMGLPPSSTIAIMLSIMAAYSSKA